MKLDVVYRSLSIKLQHYISGRQPQSRLPSLRALSKEFEVNPRTVSKAMQLLAERNLVEITRQGIFVACADSSDYNYVQLFYTSFHEDLCSDYWGYMVQEELGRALALRHQGIVVSYLMRNQTVGEFITQHGVSNAMRNGIVFINYIPTDSDIQILRTHNLPLVLLGDKSEGEAIAQCGNDTYATIAMILEHLIEHGHRKFSFIMDLHNQYEGKWLREITEQVLQQNNMLVDNCFFMHALPWQYEDGETAAEKLISENKDFSAVLCFGDQITLATIQTCLKHNLRVPEDVAITGSSVSWVKKSASVSPTGCHVDYSLMISTLLELLDVQKKGKDLNINRKIKPLFSIGRSCGCNVTEPSTI